MDKRSRRAVAPMLGVSACLAIAGLPFAVGSAVLDTPDPGRPVVDVVDDADQSTFEPHQVPMDGVDYARMDGEEFLVCDGEADDNLVKGVVHIADPRSTDAEIVEVADTGGADGSCASIAVPGRILGIQVCERNVIAWHCSNMQMPRQAPAG